MSKGMVLVGGLLAATGIIAAACGGGGASSPTPDTTATPTPAPSTTNVTPAADVTPGPTPISTQAATPTPAPTPATIPTGVPFSFDDFETAWQAGDIEVTLGAPNDAFEGFSTPAFDARLARGSDSLDLSILVYADRQALGEDWQLTVGESPVPKEGRSLPDHISTWWNVNVAVVVRARAGAISSDALDAFLSLGGPVAVGDPKVVFIRQPASPFSGRGVLWISNLDGSEQEQLTPDGIEATFAGLILERRTSNLLFYYVTRDGETARTLWSLNVDSGERSSIFSFKAPSSCGGIAAVSPDGRHVAYIHSNGVDLLDLRTAETRPVLGTGSRDACQAGTISECVGYFSLAWSPDSQLLLVGKGFYEGGTAIVVDPFQEPAAELIDAFLGDSLPAVGVWSPTSDAFCGYGRYGALSGLYVASAPDWKPLNLLPQYEQYETSDSYGNGVKSCVWLDERRIAFTTEYPSPFGGVHPPKSEISIYDLQTGEVASIITIDGTGLLHLHGSYLVGVPGGEFVVSQFVRSPKPPGTPDEFAPPELVNTSSGARQPILDEGDWVVAVVQPTVR